MRKVYYSTIQKDCIKKNSLFLNNHVISDYTDDICEAIQLSRKNGLSNIEVSAFDIEYFYKKYIYIICDYMNRVNNTTYSIKYWQTLLNLWLYKIIDKELHIYKEIKNLEKFNDVICDVFEDSEYLATFDLNDSLKKQKFDDYYNALLYSINLKYQSKIHIIKKCLHFNEQYKNVSIKNKKERILSAVKNPRKITEFIARNLLDYLFRYLDNKIKYEDRIIVRIPYPDTFRRKKNLLMLFLKSRTKIMFYYDKTYKYEVKYNKDLRKEFFEYLCMFSNSKIEKIFSEIIAYTIPKSYFEGFQDFNLKNNDLLSKGTPKMIFGVVPIGVMEDFTYYLASCRELGVKFFDAQHGLNYEFFNDIGIDEYYVSDRFYTWGNIKTNLTEVKQFIAWDLHKEFEYNKNSNKILYAITDYGKYATGIFYSNYFEYIFRNILFLKNIEYNFRNEVILRLRDIAEQDWKYSEKILMRCPWVHISDPKDSSFIDDLKKAKVFVCDDISTCIIEAFINNVPTVIILDKEIRSKNVYPNANIILKKMIEVNIAFYNPEDAAQHINNIYMDISSWWDSDVVMKVRNEFVNAFAKTDRNWINAWNEELLKNIK